MPPRDRKCLFDGPKMEHQLHLTILLRIAVHCKYRTNFEAIRTSGLHSSKCHVVVALGQHHTRMLTIIRRGPEKWLHESCRRRWGEQAQCVHSVQPAGDVNEELQHPSPTQQTPHLEHRHTSFNCGILTLHSKLHRRH